MNDRERLTIWAIAGDVLNGQELLERVLASAREEGRRAGLEEARLRIERMALDEPHGREKLAFERADGAMRRLAMSDPRGKVESVSYDDETCEWCLHHRHRGMCGIKECHCES